MITECNHTIEKICGECERKNLLESCEKASKAVKDWPDWKQQSAGIQVTEKTEAKPYGYHITCPDGSRFTRNKSLADRYLDVITERGGRIIPLYEKL